MAPVLIDAGTPANGVSARASRRRFLEAVAYAGGALGTALLWPGCARQPFDPPARRVRLGTMIGPGRLRVPDADAMRHYLAILDLDSPQPAADLIELDFFAHGVTPAPHAPERAVLFEKHGRGCCEVDLRSREMLRKVETVEGREFYGHGAYSPDGSLLYCTESDVEDRFRGVVAVRDGESFELLGEFPTYGNAPHDCHFVDAGRTLVITNGGDPIGGPSAPSVTFVEVASEKLVEKVELDNPKLNAGHVATTADRELAVVSAPRDGLQHEARPLGGLSLRTERGLLRARLEPADVTSRMIGETLSVAIHEPTRTIAATNPDGDLVSFWDLETGELRRSLDLPRVRGVALTLEGAEFVLCYDTSPRIVRVDAASLQTVVDSERPDAYATGSHIIVYDIPT